MTTTYNLRLCHSLYYVWYCSFIFFKPRQKVTLTQYRIRSTTGQIYYMLLHETGLY